MVKFKGGSRQPKTYYLREAGENKMVKIMEKEKKPIEEESKVDKVCKKMLLISKEIDVLIKIIKAKLEKKNE